MRFHVGASPRSPDFIPESPWRPMKEPSPWLAQLLALPLGAALFFGLGWLWETLTPVPTFLIASPVPLATVIVIVVVAHEWVHLLVHPQHGASANSVVGFWPSRLLFYAHYHGELTRNRFLVILAGPTLVISVLPLLTAGLTRAGSATLAFASAVNVLFSCGDLLGALLVAAQVPAGALVRNQGWRTYWRTAG